MRILTSLGRGGTTGGLTVPSTEISTIHSVTCSLNTLRNGIELITDTHTRYNCVARLPHVRGLTDVTAGGSSVCRVQGLVSVERAAARVRLHPRRRHRHFRRRILTRSGRRRKHAVLTGTSHYNTRLLMQQHHISPLPTCAVHQR